MYRMPFVFLRQDARHGWIARDACVALALCAGVAISAAATAAQDEIFGDGFDGFDHAACDPGLASDSTVAAQFAAALDLCQTTTEPGTSPGLISAALTLSSGSGAAAPQSHAIRTTFGSGNTPRAGAAMLVLSTGAAAAVGQTNPSFTAFQPGADTSTSSAAPGDWLAANGGAFRWLPAARRRTAARRSIRSC